MYWGLDLGYGQVKSVFAQQVQLDPRCVVYPSGAGTVDKVDSNPMKQGMERYPKGAVEVLVEGEPHIALVDPVHVRAGMNNLHSGYTDTKEYRALFYGALSQLNTNRVAHLVTGLPVSMWQSKRASLEKMLTGRHEIAPGLYVHIDKVSVLPQGAGAWFAEQSRMSDQSLKYAQRDNVLIVDCGHFSVDWLSIIANNVRWECSGSTSEGGAAVLGAADKLYAREHKDELGIGRWMQEVRDAHSLSALESVPIGGGVPVNLKHYLDQGSEATAGIVISKIKEKLSGLAGNVQRLIICGGSAAFYEPYLRKEMAGAKTITLMRNSVLANAQGFFLRSTQG